VLSLCAAVCMVFATIAPFSAVGASTSLMNVIVTLKPVAPASSVAIAVANAHGARVTHVYTRALNGFAGTLPHAAVSALLADPRVASVEPDKVVTASATVQSNVPTWGLDRIDQRNLPLNTRYAYNSTGAGVTAYVIDSGLTLAQPDFRGRAVSGVDTIDGGAATDCHGHGTHVAGTIGGTTYGVAKAVRLVAVRVLNCDGKGSDSQVIAGIDWVIRNHAAGRPAVANMSLGGAPSAALDNAVKKLIADGVTVTLAAGNDGKDACKTSPARVPAALTVGASDRNDALASFSNIGNCIDLIAPGVSIRSDWLANGTKVLSGTSMASPHVAAVAAQYLQRHPTSSPATVSAAIRSATTKNKIRGAAGGCLLLLLCTPDTPNNDLLFSSF